MESITPPAGFRHHYALQVRWGDMDALGHVNNAVFLTYMEQGRFYYVNHGVRLRERENRKDYPGLILAKVILDFRQPLFAEDDVHVFTRCIRLGKSSLDLEHWVMRLKEGSLEVAAQSITTIVCYDYTAGKSVPIPDDWRAMIKAYEVAPPQE